MAFKCSAIVESSNFEFLVMGISWKMLFDSNLKSLGNAPLYMCYYSNIEIYKLNCFVERYGAHLYE